MSLVHFGARGHVLLSGWSGTRTRQVGAYETPLSCVAPQVSTTLSPAPSIRDQGTDCAAFPQSSFSQGR